MNTPAQPLPNDALSHALEELYGRINYERQIRVSPEGFRLQKMRELLRRLDNPQTKFPAIHVAGTKGKGSVSTMIGSILTASGYRTAVYTSPHLETIHQRMAIDRQLISDSQLLDVLMQIRPVVAAMDHEAKQTHGPTLTFFEITTAAAMLFFAQQSVDYAVLEVGLGGRLDSTNVCLPEVCVITNISLDHTRQLGKTIDKIAREKAGIIKPNVPVVCGATKPDAVDAITEVARKQSSPLYRLGHDFQIGAPMEVAGGEVVSSFAVTGRIGDQPISASDLELNLPGVHQQINAALAVASVSLLNGLDERITPESIRIGLARAVLPGRAEIVSASPLVILDIAHNPASSAALAQTLASQIPGWRSAKKRMILFATSRDKDATGMLKALESQCDKLLLTEYQTNPRAYSLKRLVEAAKPTAVATTYTFESPTEAWDAMVQELTSDSAVCITGSAFLVAELRPIVLESFAP